MAGSRKIVDAYVELSARGAGALGTSLGRVNQAAQSAYGSMARIAQYAAGNLLASGVARLASAVAAIPSKMISANAEYERASITLEVMLGSAERARQRIEDLNKFAASTPFELPGILQASKMLELARVPAEKHQEVLRMTGDMAAAAGIDIGEMGTWVQRAYAAIQAGQPWGEAAMRLGELGVLSIDARKNLEAMQASGASGAEVWAEFTQSMGTFDGMMKKQSASFLGLASTLSDNITQIMRVIGAPLFEASKEGLGKVVEWLGSGEALAGVQAFGEGMARWVSMLIEFWSAFGGAVAGVASMLTGSLMSALGVSEGGLGSLGGTVQWVWDKFIAFGEAAADVFRNWDLVIEIAWIQLQNFGANAQAVFEAFLENARIVFTNFPQFLGASVQAAVTMLGNLGTNVWIAFSWAFEKVAGWFKGGSGSWGEAISGALTAVWEGIKSLFTRIAEGLAAVWDAIWSGTTAGLDAVGRNAIEVMRENKATGEINFVPVMKGVDEAFADLPSLVTAKTKTAAERYGSELDAVHAEWAARTDKRNQAIADAEQARQQEAADKKAADDARVAEMDAALAAKGEAAKKKDKGDLGSSVSAESVFDRIQKAAFAQSGGDKAERQRDAQLNEQRQTNQALREIAKNTANAGAVFA